MSLPPGSVRTIVTSPPYFGLRDYGSDEQIGTEETLQAYVDALVATFAALRPALADDGTLWLNLGDSFANDSKWGGSSGGKHVSALHGKSGVGRGKVTTGLAAKNLIGVPWRVAFALQADGWILRSDIIWAKPNPMPESVRDRPTKAHEYLFLFAKSPKYYYDAAAIKEEQITKQGANWISGRGAQGYSAASAGMRNKRTVWTVTPRPFKGAHFAVYPPELIRPCILAGSAPGDIVLDPFSGSGTTGMVALQEGRRYIGIDVNSEYLDLSLETRLSAYITAQERNPEMGNKKTEKRIQELRDTLADIAGALHVLGKELPRLKKKKRAAAEADIDRLNKARKKTFKELDALAPGVYDKAGWAASVHDQGEAQKAAAAEPVLDIDEKAKAKREATEAEADKNVVEDRARASAERLARHKEHLARVAWLHAEIDEVTEALRDDTLKKKARAALTERLDAAETELAGLRAEGEKLTSQAARETTGKATSGYVAPKMRGDETDEELKARVQAKRAAREAALPRGHSDDDFERVNLPGDYQEPAEEIRGGVTEEQAEAIHPEDLPLKKGKKPARAPYIDGNGDVHNASLEPKKKSKKIADLVVEVNGATEQLGKVVAEALTKETDGTTVAEGKELEDVEPVLRRDRWDRPLILTPEGKEEGYRRVTTYIDVLEDKTTLVDWKQRVVVVGVAAIEQAAAGEEGLVGIEEVTHDSVLARVEQSNRDFAAGMKKAKKLFKKGEIDAESYDSRVVTIEKEQKAVLNELVGEAFRAGDGFLKAEAGTRLHYLAECVDKGEPLPEDTTDLERRDLAALADAYRQLDLKVLDIERFVVHDGYKAGGTLDRRVSYVSPSVGRRVVAIGDIKTGRMDYGSAKMARQCAMYGASKGYDPAKPEERVNLRCNQQVALIFHLPAGSGVCTVYELDLTLGHKGLKLCQAVYDYRAETSTLKKVTAAKDGKGIAVGKGE